MKPSTARERWLDRIERRHGGLASAAHEWAGTGFMAGWRAAQRAAIAEARSRRACSAAEALVAERVAAGGPVDGEP